MKWTEEETGLLLRTRQAHPDASWKSVAYYYNAEVPDDRERSHWSLTWKYRDLLGSDPHSTPDGQHQTEGKARFVQVSMQQRYYAHEPSARATIRRRNSSFPPPTIITSHVGVPR